MLGLFVGCLAISNLVCSKLPSGSSVETANPQSELLEVANLCKLFENPELYEGRNITIKTTLYRINRFTTLGDENCVTAHSLVDVEFTSEFESRACSDGEATKAFCAIAEATRQAGDFGNFEITASIVGHFESYLANTGFTANGHRYMFLVERIENIKSINPVKTIRLT
jgi:hypothetical protein